MKKKVTVKLIRRFGENPSYVVFDNDDPVKVFSFLDGATDSIWSKESNLARACDFAKRLETQTKTDFEEIVYQTPD